ncbi:Crp/Fnr family transcriptional regulator [Sphingobacterium corticibacter]|uniref:Crp/Fnr family transcriptional regulator n=1 Tax=Sphingobacterium corticibacter TaxID=2171749 RepID=A0A2T8HKS3_9SPHI|nr:Crp/Fnr family transcriptional regulator [Sphingobacterium corticibacter]PVH26041.1 Crp/Fnr family transcriptional regulator [Sphingobacterium corticibacter]
MSTPLIAHLRKQIAVEAKDEAEILSFFQQRSYRKKESLLIPDTKCKFHFFVQKGCLRMFFLNEKGVEQTVQFAIENWWITDYLAFDRQANSGFGIQAVEASDVLQIEYSNQEKLFKKFPSFERYFRIIYQRAYSASQLRTKYLYELSREQFYHHFNDHFPEFTSRIPQHLLASYLNMTPEYLSEIKKKSVT